jgi:hypothetical protein
MLIETGAFGLAALSHLGVTVIGFAEPRGYVEAFAQMMIGLFIGISAYALWTRKLWARRIALAAHVLGLFGASFGLFVAYIRREETDLDLYNAVRLAMLVAVPLLLLTPAAKKELAC